MRQTVGGHKVSMLVHSPHRPQASCGYDHFHKNSSSHPSVRALMLLSCLCMCVCVSIFQCPHPIDPLPTLSITLQSWAMIICTRNFSHVDARRSTSNIWGKNKTQKYKSANNPQKKTHNNLQKHKTDRHTHTHTGVYAVAFCETGRYRPNSGGSSLSE